MMADSRLLSFYGKGERSTLFIRIWVFSALTITAYLITYHGVQHGITDVYPALFFIPILYATLFFPKRETIVAVALALGYFGLVYSLARDDVAIIYASTVHFILFVAFGLVAATISEQVRKRTGMYAGVIEQAESCNWIVDRRSRTILDSNPLCASLLDYIPHSLHGRPMRSLWHDQQAADTLIDEIEASRKVSDREEILIHRDGTKRYVRLSGSVLDDDSIVISSIDITPLKHAEAMRMHAEGAYRETLNAMDDPVLVIDRDHQLLLINTAAEQRLRADGIHSVVIGRKIEAIYPFTSFLSNLQNHQRIFSEKRSIRKEVSYERSGQTSWYDISVNPIRTVPDSGSATVIIHDITDVRNAEQIWRESEALHRVIFENAGSGIIILDQECIISSVNDEFCSLTGYEKGDLTGRSIFEMLFPERDRRVMMECLCKMDSASSHEEYEVKILDSMGEERDCILLTSILPGNNHRLLSILDITDERRMIELIREQETSYRQLISQIPVGIFTSRDGKLSYLNPSFCRMTGYTEKELTGRLLTDLFPAPFDYGLPQSCGEISFIHKDGSLRMGELYIRERGSSDGNEDLGILIDISQHKDLEDALRREIERRSDFVTVASHELRTPLQPVVGYIGLLLSDPEGFGLSEEVLHLLQLIQKNVDQERRIIDRMIELSVVDSGTITPVYEEIHVYSLLEDVIDSSGCRSKGDIINDVPQSAAIHADVNLLYQVFHSLITNAIQYNDPPREVRLMYSSGLRDHTIRIVDNGVGIDGSVLDQIFRPFNIADLNKNNRKYDRLGLGLPIAQRYVQLHGGEITVESRPGEGSIFTIRIPKEIEI